MNSREAVIAKLQQLSPTSLQTVDELIDSLIAQQHHQDVKAQSSDCSDGKMGSLVCGGG